MPDLVGRSEDDAVNEIVGAGLQVGSIASQPLPASDNNATAGRCLPPQRMVVKTIPAAGQRVYEGQGIGLEVTR